MKPRDILVAVADLSPKDLALTRLALLRVTEEITPPQNLIDLLPDKVRQVIKAILDLRKNILAQHFEIASQKGKIWQEAAGIAEVEKSILDQLSDELDLLDFESYSKLKILCDAIEAIPAFKNDQRADIGFNEFVRARVIEPIKRMAMCIEKKRRKVLRIEEEIKEIDDKANEEYERRKIEFGYITLEAKLKSYENKIEDIMTEIDHLSETSVNKEKIESLKKDKETLLAERKAISLEFAPIEEKINVSEIQTKARKEKEQLESVLNEKENKKAARKKLEREVEAEIEDLSYKTINEIDGLCDRYVQEVYASITIPEATKIKYSLETLETLRIVEDERGVRIAKKKIPNSKPSLDINKLVEDIENNVPMPDHISTYTRLGLKKVKTLQSYRVTLLDKASIPKASDRIKKFEDQFKEEESKEENIAGHRSFLGRTFVTAVEKLLSLFTAKPVKFSKGARVRENISMTLLGKRKELEQAQDKNNNAQDKNDNEREEKKSKLGVGLDT